MNRRAGPMLTLMTLMALAGGLAWYGKRTPARPKGPQKVGVPPPPQQPPGPEIKPPDLPKPPPVDPPPVNPPPPQPGNKPGPGWRYGDNWNEVFKTAPAGLAAVCGRCHAIPPPTVLPSKQWAFVVELMKLHMITANQPADEKSLGEMLAWYEKKAPGEFEVLPAATERGALEFRKETVGRVRDNEPRLTNVNIADLDGDGKPEILVCDAASHAVSFLKRNAKGWDEQLLAQCDSPAHTAVVDADGDGDLDVVVAVLGSLMPTEDPTGSVVLLENNGAKPWTRRDIATALPRMADVEPADVDGDGDVDFIVASFGRWKTGFVGWLRNEGGGKYALVKVTDRTGPIHVPVADLDGDGRPDFVALVSQESETVVAYVNKGGTFEAKTIFDARNPLFGSSGIQLVDLDRDGDIDVLYSNGDAFDDPSVEPKPYHGVQWLENKGHLEFEYHDVGRCYGAYRAVAVDADGDGDLDVAVAVLFGRWADASSTGLIWFENDGMKFKRHDIPSSPSHLITLAAGDLDGDGIPELVSGRMIFSGADLPGEGLLLWKIARPR